MLFRSYVPNHEYVPNMERLLYGFWGIDPVMSYGQIRERLVEAGVHEVRIPEVVRFLIECQFLGAGIDDYNFRFATNPAQAKVIAQQAGRYVNQRTGERRFKVHRAFHESLDQTLDARKRAS